MITIYSNSDIIILGIMTDDSTVGIYSVAAKIYGISKNIFIAALTVLLQEFLITLEQYKKQKSKNNKQNTGIFVSIPYSIYYITNLLQ